LRASGTGRIETKRLLAKSFGCSAFTLGAAGGSTAGAVAGESEALALEGARLGLGRAMALDGPFDGSHAAAAMAITSVRLQAQGYSFTRHSSARVSSCHGLRGSLHRGEKASASRLRLRALPEQAPSITVQSHQVLGAPE